MADHDDAQDYTANGPSAFGFRTGGANINVGAELTGKDTGVHGAGQKIGVLGEGEDAGVQGTGKLVAGAGFGGPSGVGVRGDSKYNDGVAGFSGGSSKSGVYGFNDAPGFGVYGRCNSVGGVGVQGSNTDGDGVVGVSDAKDKSGVYGFNSLKGSAPAGYGVFGRCNSANGAGVGGSSASGRGGMFDSAEAAQLQLIPHPATFKLPKVASNGDLLALDVMHPTVTGGATLDTELWFCTRGNSGAADAIWHRVQFDKKYP